MYDYFTILKHLYWTSYSAYHADYLCKAHHDSIEPRQDREKKEEYELVVLATEECLDPPTDTVAFDPRDDRLLKVSVLVADVDDNPPAFHKSAFTGGIAADVDFGAAFMRIAASDPDSGENAALQYSLDGEVVPALGSEGVEDIREAIQ